MGDDDDPAHWEFVLTIPNNTDTRIYLRENTDVPEELLTDGTTVVFVDNATDGCPLPSDDFPVNQPAGNKSHGGVVQRNPDEPNNLYVTVNLPTSPERYAMCIQPPASDGLQVFRLQVKVSMPYVRGGGQLIVIDGTDSWNVPSVPTPGAGPGGLEPCAADATPRFKSLARRRGRFGNDLNMDSIPSFDVVAKNMEASGVKFIKVDVNDYPSALDAFNLTRLPVIRFFYPHAPGGEPLNGPCPEPFSGLEYPAALINPCGLEMWVKDTLDQHDCNCDWALEPNACTAPNDGSTCRRVCCGPPVPDCKQCVQDFADAGGCEVLDGELHHMAPYIPPGCMPCTHDPSLDSLLAAACSFVPPQMTPDPGARAEPGDFKPYIAEPDPFASPSPPEPSCLDGAAPIDLTNILHNNLGGVGPDSGDEVIRYGNVGKLDGHYYDLVISVAEGTFKCEADVCSQRVSSGYGVIRMGFGTRVKLQFSFVWPNSDEEVEMNTIRFQILDFDASAKPECKEMVAVDSAIRPFHYELSKKPKVAVQENGTSTWFMTDHPFSEGADDDDVHIADKGTAAFDEQLSRAATLVFGAPYPTAEAKGGDAFCVGGIRSWSSPNVCCHADCESCGGPSCNARTVATGQSCCTGYIKEGAVPCEKPEDVGCLTPTAAPPSAPLPGYGFQLELAFAAPMYGTAHLKAEPEYCTTGIRAAKANHICCPAICGKCGGSSCGLRPGGDACCTKSIETNGTFCSYPTQDTCLVPALEEVEEEESAAEATPFTLDLASCSGEQTRAFFFSGETTAICAPPSPPGLKEAVTLSPPLLPRAVFPPPAPKPDCLDDMTIDLSKATVIQNNLGGFGPSRGDQSLRYQNAGTFEGRPFDLVVAALGGYEPELPSENGLSGGFGSVNVKSNRTASLRFGFLWTDTDEEARLPQIRFRFLDLDASSDAAFCREVIAADAAKRGFTYELGYEPEVIVQTNGTKTWFMSEHVGSESDNPTSPEALTEDQRDRSVTLVYSPVDEAEEGGVAPTPKWCAAGVLSRDGEDCCAASCGRCGGPQCEDLPGGRENCCSAEVAKSAPCTTEDQTSCVVPPPAPPAFKYGFEVDLAYAQPFWGTPPRTLSHDTDWCGDGIRSDVAEDVCCAATCGKCGGAGCHTRPGGRDACCVANILNAERYCTVGSSTGCLVPPGDPGESIEDEEELTAQPPFAVDLASCAVAGAPPSRTFMFDAYVSSDCPSPPAAAPDEF